MRMKKRFTTELEMLAMRDAYRGSEQAEHTQQSEANQLANQAHLLGLGQL